MIPFPHPAETIDQARRRLAQKARERGVTLRQDADRRWYASSVSRPGSWHYVTGFTCDCPGFLRCQRCMHHSALLAHLGWLPDDDPRDPDPVPLFVTLARGGRHPLGGDALEPTTTILVNGIATVRVTGETHGLRVHALKNEHAVDDLTGATPILFDHQQTVAYWVACLRATVSTYPARPSAVEENADAFRTAA